ncbi:ATP-binding protein [Devosia sp.]|uniref:ATP-binding protein n=1 Tax=Devosia sp. TaxID=1871048 RepID=UPI0025E74C85|nr:ATP-binding protein [Devosia sp.]MCR6633490.1 ATP-binding protein [Devosia sp.]
MSMETSPQSLSEVALREKLNAEVFDPPEFANLMRAIESQFASVAVRKDENTKWSASNRQQAKAILVTGSSRAGKSFAVGQALAELEPIQTVEGEVLTPNPIFVECSSFFDPAGLGSQILHQIGYPATREFPANIAWERVRKHLANARPAPLVIDEYQYSFQPTGVGEKRMDTVRANIQGLFRSLLDVPSWPTPLILIGTQSVLEMLEKPEVFHVREKIRDIVRIAPVTRGTANVNQLMEALTAYCDLGQVTYQLESDVLLRLIHACSGARGLILDFLKDVVVAAARSDNRLLVTKHFADIYRNHTGAHDHGNPFIEIQWGNTNPNLLLEAVDGVPRTPAPPAKRKK